MDVPDAGHALTRPPLDQPPWQPWIDEVGAAVGVATAGVRVGDVHELTQAVASGLARPMAPVSAYLWGMAVARHPERDPAELRAIIVAQLAG